AHLAPPGVPLSAAHFVASLVGCEHPFDAGAGGVALLLPGGDFAGELDWVVDSAVQGLAAQDADLDLDHVEPAGENGSVERLRQLRYPTFLVRNRMDRLPRPKPIVVEK